MIKLQARNLSQQAIGAGKLRVVQDREAQLPANAVVTISDPHRTEEGDTVFYLEYGMLSFWITELGDPDAEVRLFKRL